MPNLRLVSSKPEPTVRVVRAPAPAPEPVESCTTLTFATMRSESIILRDDERVSLEEAILTICRLCDEYRRRNGFWPGEQSQ